MCDDTLLQVHRPGQYIGREWNVSEKDFAHAAVRFALCFPDLYEVGMSNLGIRILYGILNSIFDVACERVFAPEQDMESLIRQGKAKLLSLESGKSLIEFDLLGFSLGHELVFTNILNVLDLSGIPLSSSLRDHRHPLIIGGGPCALNPEPLHEFFDLFVIGEAEEACVELVDCYRKHRDKFRQQAMSKSELLEAFSGIDGVYVPALYEVLYEQNKIKEFRPKSARVPSIVKKRIVSDFNRSFFPIDWLVPYVQIVHDRVTIEIMRGCPNSCRFCQARQQYYPLRLREVDTIVKLAEECLKASGYEEVALTGLSVSDYPGMEKLMPVLVDTCARKGSSVSFPSIKPKSLAANMSALVATFKKTGLTFAPEAATERLRKILGKEFSVEDFTLVLEQAFASGYQRLKLYFMTGIPSETDLDLDEIITFAKKFSQLRKSVAHHPAEVSLSINTLIPKPHTPFQWFAMPGLEAMKLKERYLKSQLKAKKIKLHFHDPEMSFIEAVLSRGDRRLSRVILLAFQKGCRFDAWSNHFSLQKWLDAFQECLLDPNDYLMPKDTKEILPWDFLDIGVNKQALLSEYNKAIDVQ